MSDEQLVERVAQRVVELLREASAGNSSNWVDARRVAEVFGVSRDFVYSHADELGAVPMGHDGDGRRPRLRFDLAAVPAALAALTTPRPRGVAPATAPKPATRRPRTGAISPDLLPIRGRRAASRDPQTFHPPPKEC
jgi:hypothetical protein